VGDQVALIIAESVKEAKDAIDLIEVDYDVLPAVVDTATAADPGQPQVHDEAPNNLCYTWGHGDKAATDAAFAKAAHVTTLDIVNQRLVPNAIEPRAVLAVADERLRELRLHDRAEPALEAAGLKRQLLNDDDAAIENHVSLGTMHRAKGLEFKAVAIVGCDLGVLPLRSVLDGMVDSADQALFVEQERNLLYVAVTRAREQVLVTHTSRPSVLLAQMGS